MSCSLTILGHLTKMYGVVAMNTGRNFVGIEKDEHYFQTAKDRIESALKNCTDI